MTYARFQQKIDTSAHWAKATNFIPLEGELIIYQDYDTDNNPLPPKYKNGDGVTLVRDLPFMTMELQIPITYNELKELRDTSTLLPGAWYRIIDYQCTTVQPDTRAMNNQFDIIVQAQAPDRLSEIAKADYHDVFSGTSNDDITPTIMPVALTNKRPGSVVTAYYYELVDGENKSMNENYKAADCFIDYDYLENNEGTIVPVLYKTNINGLDTASPIYEPEYTGVDYHDIFYYEGTATFEEVVYDKWRKIDNEDLTWTSTEQAYVYTNQIVQNGEIIYDTLQIEITEDEYRLDSSKVICAYYDFIDYDADSYGDAPAPIADKKFAAYSYLEDNNGNIVPVLYDWDSTKNVIGYNEEYYYSGWVMIDGVKYDKWRKIELNEDPAVFTWDTESKAYYYTNVIVDNGYPAVSDTAIQPDVANIPAWEVKYCLDNDTTRFAWAYTGGISQASQYNFDEPLTRQPQYDGQEPDGSEYQFAWGNQAMVNDVESSQVLSHLWYSLTENVEQGSELYNGGEIIRVQELLKGGKGVIYYLRDEWNNECPYDFKNIQFKRIVSLENGHPELDEENGIDTWVYTFCGNSYHVDNLEWSELQDGSLEKPYRHKSDERMGTFMDNIIKPYIARSDNGKDIGQYQLNDIVMFGFWETGNNSIQNYYTYCCHSNTFGNGCHDNTFATGCYNNVFGYGCYNNICNSLCHNNTFGNYCSSNTFGHNCSFNTFGNNYSSNTFGNNCSSNTFGHNCFSIRFGNNCEYNIFGNNCGSNTLGNNCEYNTFGNNCFSIRFGGGAIDSEIISFANYIRFAEGCGFIRLTNTETANGNNYIKNIVVSAGIRGTSLSPRELPVNRNAAPMIFEAANTTHIILD